MSSGSRPGSDLYSPASNTDRGDLMPGLVPPPRGAYRSLPALLPLLALLPRLVLPVPVAAAPTDPNPPTGVTAYSDYHTPTSVTLNWIDPATHVDGTPLAGFEIAITRGATTLSLVASGL